MFRNNRPATSDTVKCPLCGDGHIERAELVSRLHNREFNRILQNYIDEVTYGAMQPRDMLAADTFVTSNFTTEPESANSRTTASVSSTPGKH